MRRIGILAIFVLALTSCLPPKSSAPGGDGGPIPDGPRVLIDTSMGPIKVALDEKKAPGTVKNFMQYVDDKFYDGTIFHRVTDRPAVIQGGGFLPGMRLKPTRPAIPNEAKNGLSNRWGTIAMARTDDPDSATSQFYINTSDNQFLDPTPGRNSAGYCVFGKVIEGMDVVDKISHVETIKEMPRKDVIIKSIRRVE